MPAFTCDHTSLGLPYLQNTIQLPLPNRSGFVICEYRYTWDGISSFPNCDGPVIYIHTKNTGTQTAWALLPDKKKAPLWVQIDPGTDVTITAPGQISNLGLSNAVDITIDKLSFVNPAA